MENDRFNFRVWDRYTHETPAEQMQFLCFDGCLVDSDGCHHSPDDYVIEQCTGLKDKNGNLIYEGDVIQNSDKDQYVVEWCIDGYWYIRQADDEKFGCALASLKTLYDGLEIIGNIHETKDNK